MEKNKNEISIERDLLKAELARKQKLKRELVKDIEELQTKIESTEKALAR